MEQDQKFLEYVVKALVDNPDDVKVIRTVDEMGVLLTLTVNKDDMGKVIGRSGATAKSIRTVLRVVGMKNDARVNLKIEEPEGSERVRGVEGGAAAYTPDRSVDEVIKDLKSE
ncbi:MAG TPA: KH domain-containing protein [Candidatus Paceibacterota bacterium]